MFILLIVAMGIAGASEFSGNTTPMEDLALVSSMVPTPLPGVVPAAVAPEIQTGLVYRSAGNGQP